MRTLSISITRGHGDCDDCGGYTWGRASFVLDDGQEVIVGHDGHLGGGCWNGELTPIYVWALALLGYQIRLTGLEGGKLALVPIPYMYVRDADSNYVEVPFPSFEVLDVPAGTRPLEYWEVEEGKEQGEVVSRLYCADHLQYEDLVGILAPVLKSVATVGIEVIDEPYESTDAGELDEPEDWEESLAEVKATDPNLG